MYFTGYIYTDIHLWCICKRCMEALRDVLLLFLLPVYCRWWTQKQECQRKSCVSSSKLLSMTRTGNMDQFNRSSLIMYSQFAGSAARNYFILRKLTACSRADSTEMIGRRYWPMSWLFGLQNTQLHELLFRHYVKNMSSSQVKMLAVIILLFQCLSWLPIPTLQIRQS